MALKLQLSEGFALVTGAASGIGKETALAFAEAGVQGVFFADLNAQGAWNAAVESKKYALHPKYRAVSLQTDVSDDASVRAMVKTVLCEFGRLDYFVHCAGVANLSSASTPYLDIAAFDHMHAINTRGTLLCVRAVSHAMAAQKPRVHPASRRHPARSLGRGSIVVLGSVNSYVAVPGLLSYAVSKHAVLGIVKNAALDNQPHSIRVNAVCPASVDTPVGTSGGASARKDDLRGQLEKGSALRRMACTEEVADYIVFLCSPSASYINGTGLCVDAGGVMVGERGEGGWG